MVVRSQPSLRRSSRRGDQAVSAAPVIETHIPSAVTLSHRAKRNRISSVPEAENLRKKRKIEHFENTSQYKFPLRSRPNDEPLQSLPLNSGTKAVSSDQERQTSTKRIPRQKYITQITKGQRPEQRYHFQINDKRTLRSQDGGSRSKSELSLYFTNYEQMLSLESAKQGHQHMAEDLYSPTLTITDLLTARTHITLIDDLAIPSHINSFLLFSPNATKGQEPDPFGAPKPLHNAHRIDLNLIAQGHNPRRLIKDVLSEESFHRAHRKAERHEKQLRNIEKERAQHEKVQLDRLLGELRGPDWLKVMGISGVTESEKKLYEPKRIFFIKEVAGLIEKFRQWKEEEKRRKIEREQALVAGEEEEEIEDQDGGNETSRSATSAPAPISPSPPAPPDTHEVDAAAARQLHQEAISASSAFSTKKPGEKRPPPPPLLTSPSHLSHPPPPFQMTREPRSFFAKRHMREAAIAGHRRGRNKLAFGEPVPDPEEREFELPGTILTREMIRARARLRRRLRRGSEE
jgi:Something about silencing, SAS, complex subunit 4